MHKNKRERNSDPKPHTLISKHAAPLRNGINIDDDSPLIILL